MQNKRDIKNCIICVDENEVCFPTFTNKSAERSCSKDRSVNNEAGKIARTEDI